MANEKQVHKEILNDLKEREPNQRQRVLNALRQSGSDGVLNTELVRICIRYTGRLAELYKMGYEIKTEFIDKGVCKYTLIKEPLVEKSNNQHALDIILNDIESTYGNSISKDDLKTLLANKNFNIVRKYGSNKVG